MAIDVTRAGGKGRRPSNRNSFYGRVSMGQEIIQSWPKKRGKKLHPKTLAQMEIFRQAQWAFKFSSADVQRSFSESVAGTPLMPRDLFLMAVSGRMHRVIDDQGRSWWSVAAKKNISDSLDVIAQLPGQMLFRGSELWKPILQGTAGYVLTYVSEIDPPVWAPGGGSSGVAWGEITGDLADQLDLENALTAHALLTGDNHFVGDQLITGDVDIEGALTVNGSPIEATAAWGAITGTLSDQTDLQAALDAKLTVANDVTTPGSKIYFATGEFGLYVEDSVTTAKAGVEITGGGFAALRLEATAVGPFVEITCDPSTGFVECGGTDPYNFNQPPCVNGVPIGAGSTGGRALLAIHTLTANAATVAFNSIPQGFSNLVMEYEARNSSGAEVGFFAQFNGDSAAHYINYEENIFGQNSDNFATSLHFGVLANSTADANVYGSGETTIFNYSNTTRFKNMQGRGFFAKAIFNDRQSGVWKSNSAVTDILLLNPGGQLFSTGSQFRLYGIA